MQDMQDTMLVIHQATNIPRLVKSFDIISPGQLRGAHVQRDLRAKLGNRPAVSQAPRTVTKPTADLTPIITSTRLPHGMTPRAKAVPRPVDIDKMTFGRRILDFLQYPLIAGIAIGAAYSATVGQGIIGLFAIGAVALRVSSRYAFGAALILLISIPFFQAIHQSGVSQNAAIYAYELLVVGTVQAIIELLIDNRQAKKMPGHRSSPTQPVHAR
jgi:hypothetical protein